MKQTTAHSQPATILAFVGLPGSGKTTAVDFLTEQGYPKVYFGGVIYQAMAEAGIERTAASETKFREEIRAKEGKDFVVKRIVKQLHDLIAAGERRIVADGLYSWTEYKILKQEFGPQLHVVAIVAPKRLRHHRLAIRPGRSYTEKEANERDWDEIEHLEKGGPIAIADHYISNNGDLDTFHKDIAKTCKELHF